MVVHMRVNVYRNLKMKPSSLSIRCAVSSLVLGHAYHAELYVCRFVVQSSGQSRTRDTKQKNVHSWVSGNLEYVTNFIPLKGRALSSDVLEVTEEEITLIRDVTEGSPSVFKHVSYEPYTNDTFVLKGTDIPVMAAESVSIYADGTMYAREPKS